LHGDGAGDQHDPADHDAHDGVHSRVVVVAAAAAGSHRSVHLAHLARLARRCVAWPGL